MKYVAVLLCLLVCVPAVLAADVNTVIAEGTLYNTPQVQAYVYTPSSVYRGQIFTIDMVLLNGSGTVDVDLIGGTAKGPNIRAGDLTNETTYVQLSWQEQLTADTSYGFIVSQDDTTVADGVFSVILTEDIAIPINEIRRIIPVLSPAGEDLATIRSRLAEQNKSYSLNAYAQAIEIGSQIPILKERRITTTQYGDTEQTITTVTLRIDNQTNYENIHVIEVIPKAVAATTQDVRFSQEPVVLEEDPIVLWHLEHVDEQTTLSYTVEGDVDVTGNTVILAQQREELAKQVSWKLIGPLLVIPIVGILIIFFARFSPKDKKRKP